MSTEKKVIYRNGLFLYECPKCNFMTRKSGHSECRKCYIGNEQYNNEIIRRRQSRKNRRKYKVRFRCEMGYYGCERRGYCDGDC